MNGDHTEQNTLRCMVAPTRKSTRVGAMHVGYRVVVPGDDLAERLIQALGRFAEVTDAVTPDEAMRLLDDVAMEVFWRDWPNISSWAGALWRRLDEDLGGPARPPQDPGLDEVGESG